MDAREAGDAETNADAAGAPNPPAAAPDAPQNEPPQKGVFKGKQKRSIVGFR